MENTDKLVSIIVPVYKTPPEFFVICMESLRKQTYRNLEIVLVDDGSQDECALLCDTYAGMDSRINVIHQENKGISAARNIGMEATSGDYIMFVDADDWLEENCIETVLHESLRHSAELLMFQHVLEHTDGESTLPKKVNAGILGAQERKRIKLSILMNEGVYGGFEQRTVWGKLIKRDCLAKNVRFPQGLSISEDMVFNLLLFENISSVFIMNYIGYHYRMNTESITHKYNPAIDSVVFHVIREFERFIIKYHNGEPEYAQALGEGCMNMLVMIEKGYTFHRECQLNRKEIIHVSRKYLSTDLVKKYSSKCNIKNCSSIKGRFRYLLQSGKNLNLYYIVMKFISRYIWKI